MASTPQNGFTLTLEPCLQGKSDPFKREDIKEEFLYSLSLSGLSAGIYATNGPEACHYVASDCKANIIVVENQKQLDKILQVR